MTVEMRERRYGGGGPSAAQIALGLLLVVAGLVWLLRSIGVFDLGWDLLLPSALILVGAALVVTARGRDHGGWVFLGVVLTLALVLTSITPISFSGGVGDRTVTPTTAADLSSEYSLTVGKQTIDLRQVNFEAGETRIVASVGIGELVLRVPDDVAVRADIQIGAGNADVFERRYSGADVEETYVSDGYDAASRRLLLDLSVGVGNIEVSR